MYKLRFFYSLQTTPPMHLKPPRKWSCNICDATFNRRSDMRTHYKSYCFQCYVCKKTFPSVKTLNTHLTKHVVYEKWVDPVNVYLSNWSPEKSREILQNQPLVLVENLNVNGMNLNFSVSLDLPNEHESEEVKKEIDVATIPQNEIPPSIEDLKLENGTDALTTINGKIPFDIDDCEQLSGCRINIELKYSEQFDLQSIDESTKVDPNQSKTIAGSVLSSDNEEIPIVEQHPDTTTFYVDDDEGVIDVSSESDVDDMELFHCYFCDGTFRSLDALGRHVKTCTFCP